MKILINYQTQEKVFLNVEKHIYKDNFHFSFGLFLGIQVIDYKQIK